MRVLLACVLLTACSAGASHSEERPVDASTGDGSALDDASLDADADVNADADETSAKEAGATCEATSPDAKGCVCPTPGATRDCFSGDVSNRKVGLCKDGKQTCIASGELSTWGPCMGD